LIFVGNGGSRSAFEYGRLACANSIKTSASQLICWQTFISVGGAAALYVFDTPGERGRAGVEGDIFIF